MFKVSQTTGTLKRRVEVKIVDEKGAVAETVAFYAEFSVKDKDDHETLVSEFKAGLYETDEEAKALLKERITGWSKLKGTEGEIAFSQDALTAILELPQYFLALWERFNNAVSGVEA